MLYVTTRNERDAYTVHRVLRENRGPDGGFYVPFREPHFTQEELDKLAGQGFNTNVAQVLNRLFNTKLTSWDVDFAIGRYAVRLEKLGHRVLAMETWHNLESDFQRTVRNLAKVLGADGETEPGNWTEIGIRIAILFGVFGELMSQGLADQENKVDIALVSGEFSAPISAWYARRWGLPIGNIICTCNENGNLWDFICHGQLKTGDLAVPTITPEADVVVPQGLERLIYGCGGAAEVDRYLDCCRRGVSYYLEDAMLHRLRQGMYVTVSSQKRILDTISSIYSTHRYVLSPYAALSLAGLQDYRARTGESRRALVLVEKSPIHDALTVSKALGITEDALKNYLD